MTPATLRSDRSGAVSFLTAPARPQIRRFHVRLRPRHRRSGVAAHGVVGGGLVRRVEFHDALQIRTKIMIVRRDPEPRVRGRLAADPLDGPDVRQALLPGEPLVVGVADGDTVLFGWCRAEADGVVGHVTSLSGVKVPLCADSGK